MAASVLIVGAGPTGLVLALWLTRLGITVRIIDKNSGPGQTSRAMGVQARTLEFYQQLGLAEKIVALGIKVEEIALRKNGKPVAQAELKAMGQGLSPFPYVLSFPQDEHEKFLLQELASLGVSVERETELIAFQQTEVSVKASLKKEDKIEVYESSYLCGCDGARSTVRTELKLDFPGGTYSEIFFVADVKTTTSEKLNTVQLCFRKQDFCLVFPIRTSGSIRLIGVVPDLNKPLEEIKFADVAESARANTQVAVDQVNWFSTYHVHHRVAEHFQRGRVFLAGDAGHIHSPVGAQGMNTGISDAVNLAWKLAAVIKGEANTSLLASYEVERISFARKLVSTTDTLFTLVTNRGYLGTFWRSIFLPIFIPLVFHFKSTRRMLFKVVSQIRINYRHSPLSSGAVGKLQGGDRLPWVKFPEGDNFKPLETLTWQVQVYGKVEQNFRAALSAQRIPLYTFPWSEEAKSAGFVEGAAYLLRPDGYLAAVVGAQDNEKLLELWERIIKG